MLSAEMDFNLKYMKKLLRFSAAEYSKQFRQRVEETVYDALLQGNDGIIGDGNRLGTHLRAAFRDIAQPDSELRFQRLQPVGHIQRVHFERGGINQETRADKLIVHVMIAQNV